MNLPGTPAVPRAAAPSSRFFLLGGESQSVKVVLLPGEFLRAEPGTACYHGDGVAAEFVSQPQWWSRLLRGESLVDLIYRNMGREASYVTLAAPFGGKIVCMDLGDEGELLCSRHALLCSLGDFENVYQAPGSLGAPLAGWRRISGRGSLFLHGGGVLMEHHLREGESFCLEPSCLVAVSPSCTLQTDAIGGLGAVLVGALCAGGTVLPMMTVRVSGPGLAIVQTLPSAKLAARLVQSPAAGRARGKDWFQVLLGASVAFSMVLFFSVLFATTVAVMVEENHHRHREEEG